MVSKLIRFLKKRENTRIIVTIEDCISVNYVTDIIKGTAYGFTYIDRLGKCRVVKYPTKENYSNKGDIFQFCKTYYTTSKDNISTEEIKVIYLQFRMVKL